MLNYVFDRVENIVGKEENVSYQPFSPFPTMSSKIFLFQGHSNWGLFGKGLNWN